MHPNNRGRKPRRGFALIPVLFLIALLAAAAAQLATVTGVESVRQARQADTLRHELAVDSALRVAARVVRQTDSELIRALDRDGVYTVEFDVGDVHVHCRVTDDGAKLDVHAFGDDGQRLRRALQLLARGAGLDDDAIALSPLDVRDTGEDRSYAWFDQLFDAAQPGTLFRWDDDAQMVWSDLVTCFGPGRVDVRRASRPVLEAVLHDIDRTLAGKLVAARGKAPDTDPRPALASLDGDLRRRAESRLDYDLHRYALDVTTGLGADRRRWYLVATITDDDENVHNRGSITW